MSLSTPNFRAAPAQIRFDTEPLRSVQSHLLEEASPLIAPYPPLLIVDADEGRAQRLARILTLANYRPIVVSTPVHAFKRYMQGGSALQAVLLGKINNEHRFILQRLLQQLLEKQPFNMPVISVPLQVPDRVPLYAKVTVPTSHIVSYSCSQVLEEVWRVLPLTRGNVQPARHSMILEMLPTYGMQPRVSQRQCVRSSYFRQMLKAAYDMMPPEQWEMLMVDVGLAQYRRLNSWPPIEDNIPAEYVSCLNQAVAFACPTDPVEQLRRWGENANKLSIEEKAPSSVMQQILKLASPQQVLGAALKAFARKMNEIRGEELCELRSLTNGNFWLVHYSNLYAYGRMARLNGQPMCHVWLAQLEALLQRAHLERHWQVVELECSCQTQTGHCLFEIRQRRQLSQAQ